MKTDGQKLVDIAEFIVKEENPSPHACEVLMKQKGWSTLEAHLFGYSSRRGNDLISFVEQRLGIRARHENWSIEYWDGHSLQFMLYNSFDNFWRAWLLLVRCRAALFDNIYKHCNYLNSNARLQDKHEVRKDPLTVAYFLKTRNDDFDGFPKIFITRIVQQWQWDMGITEKHPLEDTASELDGDNET